MFTNDVIEALGHYVYRLIDPRTGETFYVGKGQGNRLFSHAAGAASASEEIDPSEKISQIRQITLAGLEVAHVVHRHGLDKGTAIEVEAALIDAYPGITNIAGGHGSGDAGAMHSREIIEKYRAIEAEFHHPVVAITINRTSAEMSTYDAVRYAWRIDRNRATGASYVLAVVRGLIVGVFTVDKWLEATPQNFPGTEISIKGRYGFVGSEADDDVQKAYLRKRIPDKFRKQGAASPIRYYGFD